MDVVRDGGAGDAAGAVEAGVYGPGLQMDCYLVTVWGEVVEDVCCEADGWVSGEGELAFGREDLGCVFSWGGVRGVWVVQDHGFGVVELDGEGLFLGLGQWLGGGHVYEGELVAGEGRRGEDVEGVVGESLSGHFVVRWLE